MLWYVGINVVVAQGVIDEKIRMFEIELLTCSYLLSCLIGTR